jgi:hypothetical protein
MLAVVAGNMPPVEQLRMYWHALSSIGPSLFERTDALFKRTTVYWVDEHGNLALYDDCDPVTNEITKRSYVTYIEHLKSGNLYWEEDEIDGPTVVKIKCFLLILGTPFYTIGQMGWQFGRTFIKVVPILIKILSETWKQPFVTSDSKMGREFSQLHSVIGDGLFEIIKAPIFGFGIEVAALCGIFKPFHARHFEAIIERIWQQGVSYRCDFRYIYKENGYKAIPQGVSELRPLYLAYCFQPRHNVKDSDIKVQKREEISYRSTLECLRSESRFIGNALTARLWNLFNR